MLNLSLSPSPAQTQPWPPVSINPAHHAALLQLCQTPRELKQIHAASIKTGLFPHSPAFSSHLLALHSRPDLATLDEARSVLARIHHPTAFSWNALIKRCVEDHHSHTALALFSDMLHRSSAVPDNFTLPCVIKGCARLNAVQEGKQIHGLILKLGFGPDGFVQSSLVSFYCKCGDLVSAREVFDIIAWTMVGMSLLLPGSSVESPKANTAEMLFFDGCAAAKGWKGERRVERRRKEMARFLFSMAFGARDGFLLCSVFLVLYRGR